LTDGAQGLHRLDGFSSRARHGTFA